MHKLVYGKSYEKQLLGKKTKCLATFSLILSYGTHILTLVERESSSSPPLLSVPSRSTLASAVHSCPDTACPMVASSEQACLSSASSCCSPSTKPDQDHQPLHLCFFPIDSSSNSTTSSLSHPDRQSTRVSCTQIKSDSTPSLIQALSFQSLLLSSS